MSAVDALRAQITAKLAALGADENAVADALAKAGIRGDHSGSGCPIATYIKTTVPGLLRVAVTPPRIGVAVDTNNEYTSFTVVTPAAVCGFVIGFELGEFPQLDTDPQEVVFLRDTFLEGAPGGEDR